MKHLRLAALTLILASLAPLPSFAQQLSDATFPQWRDYILPKPSETRWREIPWRANFWSAAMEANTAEKPLLIWAMNGHPCGST
jgi:hypothetical protein